MAKITINGITTDPLAPTPVTAAAESLLARDAADSNFILVQTGRPLNRAERDELVSKGASILEYVPENTYLCRFEQTDLGEIRSLPYVTWANVYLQGFKVAPTLSPTLPARPGERSVFEVASLPAPTFSTAPKTVDIVFHRDVDPEYVREKVAAAARLDPADIKLDEQKVRLTAPRARLVLQSVLDASGHLGGLPADLQNLFRTPYQQDGARVHTNSWGSTAPPGTPSIGGVYNQNAKEVDDFIWRNRDCVVCFAAGNEGQDADANGQIDAMSVTPPGTAKNCITVGATENDRPNFNLTYGAGWPPDFPAEPIASDNVSDNPEGMVGFSSRGPTRDGRVKPDVVAPGTFILSTRSRVTHDTGWALSGDDLYYYMGGTSMATPLVAGCAALVREFLIVNRGLPAPSAALVKAMLINGARNIVGQYVPSEAGVIPNNAEGFGRVDMRATVGPFAAGETVEVRDEATALDTGDEESLTLEVAPGANLLKVTLVWTDPAGESLQNDLDLILRLPGGQERHGNVAAGSTEFDRSNNVEQVSVANPPAGNTTIIVRAHRVAQFPQTYALVVRTA